VSPKAKCELPCFKRCEKALNTGNFESELQAVRDDCEARKCYDVSNWGNNFKNNAALF